MKCKSKVKGFRMLGHTQLNNELKTLHSDKSNPSVQRWQWQSRQGDWQQHLRRGLGILGWYHNENPRVPMPVRVDAGSAMKIINLGHSTATIILGGSK
jgi:hypothetical protein